MLTGFTDKLRQQLEAIWYAPHHFACYALWPLAKILEMVAHYRYYRFQQQKKNQRSTPVPLIVIGNLTVGGTGKTPLVIALVQRLLAEGYRPAVLSRGYAAQSSQYPIQVSMHSSAHQVGDEPLLIYQQTQVPVMVDPQRRRALNKLLQQHSEVDVIISDDGLQHYAMARDLEIVVVDGVRGWGNGLCLPAGPLRESLSRLKQIDFLVVNGGAIKNFTAMHPQTIAMELQFSGFCFVKNQQPIALEILQQQTNIAIAGIGHPQRFFNDLKKLNLNIQPIIFADHYRYQVEDFKGFPADQWIIMTEKDAVKCKDFAGPHWVYLKISAHLNDFFWQLLLNQLAQIKKSHL